MPQDGRDAIVSLAEQLIETRKGFGHLELPRQALVPFGGAAPVDVYVAARPEALLCVVMATYSPQNNVSGAVSRAVVELDALLEAAQEQRTRRRGRKPSSKGATVPPPRKTNRPPSKSSRSGRKTQAPPALDFDDDTSPNRATIPFLAPPPPPGAFVREARRPTPPPLPPEVTVTGEATVGRSTLAAIEVDRDAPEISYGLAPIGRRTIAEIELSEVPKGDPRSSAPVVRVELASMPALDPKSLDPLDRRTLPFTESAEELKRAFDAAQRALAGEASTLKTSAQRTVIVGHSKPRDGSAPQIVVEAVTEEGSVPPPPEDENPSLALPDQEAGNFTFSPPDGGEVTLEMAAPPDMSEEPAAEPKEPESAITESGERPRRSPLDSGIEDWHKALSAIAPPRPNPKVGRGATGFAAVAGKKKKR